ncbi:MAG: AAA family ATPase [Cryobacterium sp.]|nr:AAA family ATPase [Cryobacterium sp.]
MSAPSRIPFPQVSALVTDTRAELTVGSDIEVLTAESYLAVRKLILGRVLRLARERGQDVLLGVEDHTGRWRLVVQVDGQLREDDLLPGETAPLARVLDRAEALSLVHGPDYAAPVTPLLHVAELPVPIPELQAPAERPNGPDLPMRRDGRASFITEERREPAASEGWRGALARAGIHVQASEAEQQRRRYVQAVSQHWAGPRRIAVVNGKGGVGKTVTNAMLAAVFARNGGAGVLAWDNNDTRGTLGWRTEKGPHEATVQDLLPATEQLLSPAAQVSDLARFVHHQTQDKYDVLRSNPELLATGQRITQEDFDALHQVAAKYFRMVFFDSGNDESAPRWLRMIDHTDQLVVATTALGEPAESGALLLEALEARDEHSARLARSAVVVVLQSERQGTRADAQRIANGFSGLARIAVTIPFDRALHGGALRFDAIGTATQNAWLRAGAAVAAGL